MMSHLNTLEVYSCLDTLFSTLYGVEVYRQWKELKSKLQFETEHLFVQWMLDYITENYSDAQRQLHITSNKVNKFENGREIFESCESSPDTGPEECLLNAERKSPRENENEALVLDFKDDDYFHIMSDDESGSKDNDKVLAKKTVNGQDLGIKEEVDSPSVNYLDVEMTREYRDMILMNDSNNAQNSITDNSDQMHLFRPFHCDICAKRYSCRGNLIQHQKEVHINPRRFPCEFCSKTFSRERHLDRHIKTLHLGIKQFLCHSCNKAFSRRDQLFKHTSKCYRALKLGLSSSTPSLFDNHSNNSINVANSVDDRRDCIVLEGEDYIEEQTNSTTFAIGSMSELDQ